MPLRPSDYYAEPLAVAQMRGAQLGKMRQNAEMQRAQTEAEMQAYGATSLRDLMLKKAMMTREQAAMESQDKKFNRAKRYLMDLQDIAELKGPEVAKQAIDDPEYGQGIKDAVSMLVDPESLSFSVEGVDFIPQVSFEGRVKTRDGKFIDNGIVEATGKKAYRSVRTPEGEYFQERPVTQKLAGKVGDSATALQKNTAFIAKTLKKPKERALQMAMESKVQSREAFIMSMVGRLVSSSIGGHGVDQSKIDEMKKNAGDLWDNLNKERFGATKEAPATSATQNEIEWLDNTFEEMGMSVEE